jgi:hypothetical protein
MKLKSFGIRCPDHPLARQVVAPVRAGLGSLSRAQPRAAAKSNAWRQAVACYLSVRLGAGIKTDSTVYAPANVFESTAPRSTHRGFRAKGGSFVDDRKGADRRARAAFELQRHAKETELAFAEQLFKIHQPFPMTNAKLAA